MMEKSTGKRSGLCLQPSVSQGEAKRPNVAAANREKALAALKSTYGYTGFRGKQEEAILAVMSGRDVLVIMPTGGGKTLCYAVPAMALHGLAVVVSPLIALMQDQVTNLCAAGIPAAHLSSALPASARSALMEQLWEGARSGTPPRTRLLLVTPELLAASEGFRSALRRLHAARLLSLFAVDEAHCISSWGHDFRPAYRRLQALRRDFPGVPIMALTATAATKVQDDIASQLRLREPLRLLSSFNRPNIAYTVRYLDAEEVDAEEALVRLLRQRRDAAGGRTPCAIVYCQKRDTCEEVAGRLAKEGLPAAAYHAKLPDGTKEEVLRRWQGDEVPVVCATIAFGMGIDKAGVRLVVHLNLPRSVEGYYQESGRAGRDGAPAESVVMYSREDRRRMDFILQKDQEKKDAKKKAQAAPAGGPGGEGRGAADGDEEAAVAAAAVPSKEEEAQMKATAWQAFGCVVEWATSGTCRRRGLLAHFGEAAPPGACAGTGDGRGAGCDVCRDPQRVRQQLEALRRQEEEEAASRGRGPWGRRGKGEADDGESADMFAVRSGAGWASDTRRRGGGGGAGGGGGGGEDEGGEPEGPGFVQAGRRSPVVTAEARYARAAALRAAGGQVDDRYFAKMEAMERAHERRAQQSGEGDAVDRMLAARAGGGRRTPPRDPTPRPSWRRR